MLWVKFTLLLLYTLGLDGYGGWIHEDVHMECTNRFEYRHRLRQNFRSCEDLVKSAPMCGKDITIAYAVHPPYVFHEKDGNVTGILPVMLKLALETCCFGCNALKFSGPFNHVDKFYQNSTLVMPIQTSRSINKYFGHDFVHMYEVKAVNFIGPEPHHDPNMMIKIILRAVMGTWPLFATALFMAITAGVAIWVLDNPRNERQFPSSFPRGPFEGFWWAVVSMTTVGYGDRSPRSVCARLFAMAWILIGITIFSMYAATLTSSLTSAVIALHDVVLYKKTFAVLNTTSLGTMATMKESAEHKGYSNIDEMIEAMEKQQVDGMALEEKIANYYVQHMPAEKRDKLQLYHRLPFSLSSYGMLSYNKNMSLLFNSFFQSNDDQRDIMAKLGMGKHSWDGFLDKRVNTGNIFISTEMLTSTLVGLTIAATCLAAIGLFVKQWKSRKEKSTEIKKDQEMFNVAADPVGV